MTLRRGGRIVVLLGIIKPINIHWESLHPEYRCM